MAKNNSYTVPYRRKRKGATSYKTRLRLIQSGKPRLVIRKSLRNIRLQIIEYSSNNDKVLFSASSAELKKLGWKPKYNLDMLVSLMIDCGLNDKLSNHARYI